MRTATRQMVERREKVMQVTLDIIEQQNYATSYEVSDKTGIGVTAAALILLNNAAQWDLDVHYVTTTVNEYSTSGTIHAYTKRGVAPPEKIELGKYAPHKLVVKGK